MAHKNYYIPFKLSAKVNYIYIFKLYSIANYNIKTKAYDTIQYKSIKKLAEALNIPYSTFNKIIKDTKYKDFFSIDNELKVITLNTDFHKKENENTNKIFVKLQQHELEFLKQSEDNLLCKYYLYIKFFCGYAKSKGIKQDFTAKQFLDYCGYSTKSNSYISQIATYNGILKRNNFINIEKYTDDMGYERNIYTTNF